MKKRIVQNEEVEVVDETRGRATPHRPGRRRGPLLPLLWPDGQIRMRLRLGDDGSTELAIDDDNGEVQQGPTDCPAMRRAAWPLATGTGRSRRGRLAPGRPAIGMQVKDGKDVAEVRPGPKHHSTTVEALRRRGKGQMCTAADWRQKAKGSCTCWTATGDLQAMMAWPQTGHPGAGASTGRKRGRLDDAMGSSRQAVGSSSTAVRGPPGSNHEGVQRGQAPTATRRIAGPPRALIQFAWPPPASAWHRPPRPLGGGCRTGPRPRACRTPRVAQGRRTEILAAAGVRPPGETCCPPLPAYRVNHLVQPI